MFLIPFLYFISILLFIFSLLAIFFVVYGFYCELRGGPFIPTGNGEVEKILKLAKLKKGQLFLDLGSGDGRVVRMAVKNYQVKGSGIEINLFLNLYARLVSKLQGIKNASFKRENLFKVDLTQFDVIFLFLLPKTLRKLKNKLAQECREDTLIISRGFQIAGFEKKLIFQLDHKYFPTYFYKNR